jgi:hypothetical protein
MSRRSSKISGDKWGINPVLPAVLSTVMRWLESCGETLVGKIMTREEMFSHIVPQSTESLLARLVASRLKMSKSIFSFRKFAILDLHMLALVPAEACCGDILAILPHHSFPIVLRSLKSERFLTSTPKLQTNFDSQKSAMIFGRGVGGVVIPIQYGLSGLLHKYRDSALPFGGGMFCGRRGVQ